jgi:hypothetical protein
MGWSRVARVAAGTVSLGLALGLATPARAEPPKTAEQLFDEGDALAQAGNYAAACPKFESSFGVDHALGAELRLADCLEHTGELVRAWRLYGEAADGWTRAGDGRAKYARDRQDALAAKVAIVSVAVAAPVAGLAVTVAGEKVDVASTPRLAVRAGVVHVTATAPGRAAFEKEVQAVVGATAEVTVPALAATATHETDVAVDKPPPPRRNPHAIAIGAAGVAVLIGAGAIELYAQHTYNHAFDIATELPGDPAAEQDYNSANSERHVAIGAAVVGAGLVGWAAWRYVHRDRAEHAVVAAPLVAPGVAGVAIGGGW